MSVRGNSGLRSRNFSQLTGSVFYTFEYTWTVSGQLRTFDLHLLYHSRLSMSTSQVIDLQNWVARNVLSSWLPEIFQIFQLNPGLESLTRSWFTFLNSSNCPELHDLLTSCQFFSALFNHPSFDDITGVYADFNIEGDGSSHLLCYFVLY